MLHFDLEGAKPSDTEWLMDETPRDLQVGNQTFRKQLVTFHNSEMNAGHFVSAQQYEEDWVWYDGLQTPTLNRNHKRIRKITPDGNK